MPERPILNYSTKIDAERTIGEIQKMLAEHGANAVMTEFNDDGIVSAVSFRLEHKGQQVFFRLPANIDPIYVLVQRHGDRPPKRTYEHATRVAWRIIRQWIEAQLAIVQCDQVDMVEVFLPFAQNPRTGRTVYAELEASNFAMLTHDSTAVTAMEAAWQRQSPDENRQPSD